MLFDYNVPTNTESGNETNEQMMNQAVKHVISDEQLVDRFQQGENRAFDDLVHRYEQKIRSLCFYYLSDAHEVDDAAQETFIKAYHGLKHFRPQARFSTWLIRIAINHCLNQIRSRRRRRWLRPFSQLFLGEDEKVIQSEVANRNPLQELEHQEKLQQVQRALLMLPESQRIAVILHRSEGLSYQEIAEVTGSSISAVEAKLHRAKLKLATILAPYFLDQK